MKEIIVDKNLVSCCWNYCGACAKYLAEECPGCRNLTKSPIGCTIRTCCLTNGYLNCSQCLEYPDTERCNKFNDMVMKDIGCAFGTECFADFQIMKNEGILSFAEYMARNKTDKTNS